jgi:hypothetical protein
MRAQNSGATMDDMRNTLGERQGIDQRAAFKNWEEMSF